MAALLPMDMTHRVYPIELHRTAGLHFSNDKLIVSAHSEITNTDWLTSSAFYRMDKCTFIRVEKKFT